MAVLAPPAGRRAKRSLSPAVPAEVATRHEHTCAGSAVSFPMVFGDGLMFNLHLTGFSPAPLFLFLVVQFFSFGTRAPVVFLFGTGYFHIA